MRIFARTDRTFFVAIFNSISNYSVVLYNVLYSDYIKTTKVTSQKVTKIKPNKQKQHKACLKFTVDIEPQWQSRQLGFNLFCNVQSEKEKDNNKPLLIAYYVQFFLIAY